MQAETGGTCWAAAVFGFLLALLAERHGHEPRARAQPRGHFYCTNQK